MDSNLENNTVEKLNIPKNNLIPISVIEKIIRVNLSEGIKISKESKEFIQEILYEFILFIISDAELNSKNKKRKTITMDDIFSSLQGLGFNYYITIWSIFITKYNSSLIKN